MFVACYALFKRILLLGQILLALLWHHPCATCVSYFQRVLYSLQSSVLLSSHFGDQSLECDLCNVIDVIEWSVEGALKQPGR